MAASYLPKWADVFGPSDPRVRFTLPPASYFKFPPSSVPTVLPPPPNDPSLAHPFSIPVDVYNALLSPSVPITVALVYATAIAFLNGVNARRNLKPWAISKTRLFTLAVLLHNLFLALYSAWTCVGMVNALRLSFSHWSEEYGLAGAVDSLCKLHGPRGMSSAATFSPGKSEWSIYNTAYHLSAQFFPETTDVGRIWNEGLAFYGWLFYISKSYEVVDTFIIIAKGKKSSFLQTYHHAGAMMCMWAGIRYMSPPIWMFVMVNSFIHAVMYTFYFFTALHVRVPKALKQILTTMQITQFIVGLSFALLHLFIEYQVPVKTPYVVHIGQQIVEGASALGADAASQFSSVLAAATAAADTESWLKKFALRAAGREGLAENVVNRRGQTFGIDAAHSVSDFVKREEVRYRDELKWTHCLDTSGQTLGIYLNVIYLLPLTWLFIQFFVNSYIKRSEVQRRKSLSEHVSLAGRSFTDARKGVGRRLSEAYEDTQGWNGDSNGEQPVVIDGQKVREELKKLDAKLRDEANKAAARVPTAGDVKDSVKSAAEKTAAKVDEIAVETPTAEEVKDVVKQGAKKAKDTASQAVTETVKTAEQLKQETAELVQSTSEQISASTGMDLDDVLKKAWATVDSSKGKSTSSSTSQHQGAKSSSQHASTSSSSVSRETSSFSTTSEVSSTTVFESSSISRAAQDEVINSSQIVRDEDVNTKTGDVKKEGLHIIASQDSNLTTANMSELPSVVNMAPQAERLTITGEVADTHQGDLQHPAEWSESRALQGDRLRPGMGTSDAQAGQESPFPSTDINVQSPQSTTTAKPPRTVSTPTSTTTSSSSSSSPSEEEPFDEFSQTRPTSGSTHASPAKPSLSAAAAAASSQRSVVDETTDDSANLARQLFRQSGDDDRNVDAIARLKSIGQAENNTVERSKQRSVSPSKIPVLMRPPGVTGNSFGMSLDSSNLAVIAAPGINVMTSKSKSESKSETKSESKSESRAESKSESRSESKSESRSESKSESKAESKSESKSRSTSRSTSTSPASSESESASISASSPTALTPQSRKWHSRRRGQQVEDRSGGGEVDSCVGGGGVDSRSDKIHQNDTTNSADRAHLPSTSFITTSSWSTSLPRPSQGFSDPSRSTSTSTSTSTISSTRSYIRRHERGMNNPHARGAGLAVAVVVSHDGRRQKQDGNKKVDLDDDDDDDDDEEEEDMVKNDDDDNNRRHNHQPRKIFNQRRDRIEDVTSQKGDDDTLIL